MDQGEADSAASLVEPVWQENYQLWVSWLMLKFNWDETLSQALIRRGVSHGWLNDDPDTTTEHLIGAFERCGLTKDQATMQLGRFALKFAQCSTEEFDGWYKWFTHMHS